MPLKRSASPAAESAKKRAKLYKRTRLWDIEFEDERDLELRLEEESIAAGTEMDVAGIENTADGTKLDLATCIDPRSSPAPTEVLIQIAGEVESLSADDYEMFEESTYIHVRSSPTPTEVLIQTAEEVQTASDTGIELSEALSAASEEAPIADDAGDPPSELVICSHLGQESARLPLGVACKESEVITRILDASKDSRLVDEFCAGSWLWKAIESWLRGNPIDVEAPGWDMFSHPYLWAILSRFLRHYQMERLLNELSDLLRSWMLSPAPDARLWTRKPKFRFIETDSSDALGLLKWLNSREEDPHRPLEKMVKEHLAYHMAHGTPAAKAFTTSPKYQELLMQNHLLCAELALLQYSNDGAGPEHPSTRPQCHYHKHSNGQNARISLSPVVVNQATLVAIKDLLGDTAEAHLKVEANICPSQE